MKRSSSNITFTFNDEDELFGFFIMFTGIVFNPDLRGVNCKDPKCILGLVADACLWDFIDQAGTDIVFRSNNDRDFVEFTMTYGFTPGSNDSHNHWVYSTTVKGLPFTHSHKCESMREHFFMA